MIERLVYHLVCDPWKSLLVIFRLLQFICWVANTSTVCLLFLSCYILCIGIVPICAIMHMRRKWRMLTYSRSPSLQLVIWFSIFTFFYLLTCAGFSSEWSIYSVVYSTDTKSTSCTLTPYEAQLCIPSCLLLLLSHFSLYIMTKFLHSHRYHSTSVYFVRFALSVLCIWSFYIICFFSLSLLFNRRSLFVLFFLSFGYISKLVLTFRWHLHWNKDVCRSSCGICFAFVLYWCVICARWEFFCVWP